MVPKFGLPESLKNSTNSKKSGGWIYEKLEAERGLPDGSDSNEFACNAGDLGSTPGSGRSPGEANGNPLQYLLGEFHGQRGNCQATWGLGYMLGYMVCNHGVAKSRTRLSN